MNGIDPFSTASSGAASCAAVVSGTRAGDSPQGGVTPDPADPPPPRPPEPDAADCCGEGCVRCVFDVYEQALERYEAALAAWRARQP